MADKNSIIIVIITGIILGMLAILVYAAPTFTVSETTTYLTEDQSPVFTYNFSANVTNDTSTLNLPWVYSIENVSSNLYPVQNSPSFYTWIIINSATGVMSINATNDSQTGKFNITIKVLDSNLQGSQRTFYFIANATNDAPNFTVISNAYNTTQNTTYITYINATDEENHFPLVFNANFTFTNCALAPWSTRNNCTLFSFRNVTNSSSIINITPSRNDVGVYYANISVMDRGSNYTCISGYCGSDYSQNKTTYYTKLVNFTIFALLDINFTNCQNKIFQQNQSGQCFINITTKSITDNFNVSSKAFTRNYPGNIFNSSWFYYFNQSVSSNYSSMITINFTPQTTEVGNWTINFTLWDINFSSSLMNQINVYVNKTINYAPIINDISNQNAGLNSSLTIPLTVYDDDMLIPDKNMLLGGYNETLNFSAIILNQTNLSQNLTINGYSNFTVQIVNMPVAGTNRTIAVITLTPNITSFGNFTINLTAVDRSGARDFKLFNLTILQNGQPVWADVNTTIMLSEHSPAYFNFSMNVSDPDSDHINFTFTNDTSFPGFNLNITTGICNFTPSDVDVGQHLVTIIASDGIFSVPRTFNFTVYNLNESPYIEKPILQSSVFNASVDVNSNINAAEDNLTEIDLWVQDNDLAIAASQKSFYNESLTLNLTIEGVNSSIFQFIKNSSFPSAESNRSKYEARFTPRKSDIGVYNITINITDNSNLSDLIRFNLTITSIDHNPVIMTLSDQVTAVNRSFYYRINATDTEDGLSTTLGNTNLTFAYSFLNGTDFINNNQTIFNRTTGELNLIFNSSQGGLYRLNITVNDTGNKSISGNFWIYVYDIPSLNYPSTSYQFNFAENSSNNLTFRTNHTIRNNLTYLVYTDNVNSSGIFKNLIYNQSFYGNNSNLTFLFAPDFKNETYGVKNLTLVVYPSDSLLANAIEINRTVYFNLTINHTNNPVSFYSNIGGLDGIITGGSPQTLTLSDYFSDADASDAYYNQTVRFGYSSIGASGGAITVGIVDWINGATPSMSFSASSDGSSTYAITAYEYNQSNSTQIIRNVTGNSFSVNITVSTVTVSVPTSGGGGGGGDTTPVSFKIISPGVISTFVNQKMSIPLKIVNYGKKDFREIKLISRAYKNGKITNLIESSLDQDSFNSLSVGESKDFKLNLFLNTNETGDYELLINGSSIDPEYHDWVKVYINLRTINKSEAEKYLLFTQEYIVQNPQCIELKEVLDQANAYMEKGDYSNARAKAEEAINACKQYISQVSVPKSNKQNQSNLINYLVLATFGAFVLGIFYYMIKRRRFAQTIKMREQGNL